jgi:hypothetical protein
MAVSHPQNDAAAHDQVGRTAHAHQAMPFLREQLHDLDHLVGGERAVAPLGDCADAGQRGDLGCIAPNDGG